MSGKIVLTKGNTKSERTLVEILGKRCGKGQAAALYEVYDEMSVYPPVTKQEAEAFLRLHTKRCQVNLANAKDRGDKRATLHLERKLAVYQYLRGLVTTQEETVKAMRECPHCRVTAVDNLGHCHCCGKDW